MKKFYSILFLALLFAITIAFPSQALAATFLVNSTVDDVDANPGDGICQTATPGECTMRAAIEESNSLSGSDSVLIPLGTYLFTVDGTIVISDDISITGADQSLTFIEQGGFLITSPINFSMSQLTIQNGGNPIDNSGGANLSLANVTISNNFGHGVNSSAGGSSLSLSNTIISNNTFNGIQLSGFFSQLTATNAQISNNGGAGIASAFAAGSTINLSSTQITNNNSAGISVEDNNVTLQTVVVDGNRFGIGSSTSNLTLIASSITNNLEGGIQGGNSANISDSVISGNGFGAGPGSPGGGIGSVGNLTLTRVVVENNHSNLYTGGVYNPGGNAVIIESTIRNNSANLPSGSVFNDGNGVMTIERSTISGNTDGGILNNGTLDLINSTVSGNTDNFPGTLLGGLHNANTATILNSTITLNGTTGEGGIFNENNLTLKNSIVAENFGTGNCAGFGTIVSDGNNIDSDGTCNLTASGDQPNTNPLLGPLQNNGGPTFTHALLTGSPAIDTGNNTGCPSTDQRGVPRPQDGDNNLSTICDIGAYEVEALVIPPLPIIIDIKPGADPNTIKLGSNGNVSVAIFSSPTFDATQVDPLTVTLASAPVRLKGQGQPAASIEDINDDGLDDLVVQVSTEALVLTATDTEAILEGETFNNSHIQGSDFVRVIE